MRKTGVRIVDWELAGAGDPAVDIGAFLCNYVSLWLASVPVSADDPSEELVASAQVPLDRMQPAIKSFWESYTGAIGADGAASGELLLRSVRHAGARLVQNAFEHLRRSLDLDVTALRLLQLAENILYRPEETVVHVLGLRLKSTA
jgi:hypothetical protein